MAIQSGTVRYTCVITTVDPTATTPNGDASPILEGVIKSGKSIQISLYNIPPAFRWPIVGETWMVIQYNGSWYLDGLFPNATATSDITHYDQGDFVINAESGKVAVVGSSDTGDDDTDFAIYYDVGLGTLVYAHDGTVYPLGSEFGDVISFAGRSGIVVPEAGDYDAAQVTHAADKSSSSQQTFSGGINAPYLAAAGLTGADEPSRYVGATTLGAPATGSFEVGDFVIDQSGSIWIYNSSNDWVQLEAAGTFIYNQLSASNIWTIPHNLNRYPPVFTQDSSGNEVVGDVSYPDPNNVTVTFTYSQAGTAYLAK